MTIIISLFDLKDMHSERESRVACCGCESVLVWDENMTQSLRSRRSACCASASSLELFHELRCFFDPGYRLLKTRTALQRGMHERGWGLTQLFEHVDSDGSGFLDSDELKRVFDNLGASTRRAYMRSRNARRSLETRRCRRRRRCW